LRAKSAVAGVPKVCRPPSAASTLPPRQARTTERQDQAVHRPRRFFLVCRDQPPSCAPCSLRGSLAEPIRRGRTCETSETRMCIRSSTLDSIDSVVPEGEPRFIRTRVNMACTHVCEMRYKCHTRLIGLIRVGHARVTSHVYTQLSEIIGE
jgi:hypothetical protein